MMSFKLSRSSKVNRILLISLTNIGDVVMTFPVIDELRAAFPQARLDIVAGPKALTFFNGNPHIGQGIAFDKRMGWAERLGWLAGLRRMRYDLVIDLRNTLVPFLIHARTVTSPFSSLANMHMKDKHLTRLRLVIGSNDFSSLRSALVIGDSDRDAAGKLLRGWKNYMVMAPGAADSRKRWSEEGFVDVLQYLHSRGKNVVMVGDQNDRIVAERILSLAPGGGINLCGRTSLLQLAAVLAGADLALVNDSGIMHLASYLDRPVVALFGPTDPFYYGPWGSSCVVLRKGLSMAEIKTADVIAVLG